MSSSKQDWASIRPLIPDDHIGGITQDGGGRAAIVLLLPPPYTPSYPAVAPLLPAAVARRATASASSTCTQLDTSKVYG
jgi:hypothetical protein